MEAALNMKYLQNLKKVKELSFKGLPCGHFLFCGILSHIKFPFIAVPLLLQIFEQ